jgi:MFS family permease
MSILTPVASVGILVMIVPVFQSEISHAKIRGILISLQQAMLGIGALAASWIGYGCFTHWQGTGDSAQWRIPYVEHHIWLATC